MILKIDLCGTSCIAHQPDAKRKSRPQRDFCAGKQACRSFL